MFPNYLNQNKPSQRFKTLDHPNNFEFCEKKNTMYEHYLNTKSPILLDLYKKYKNKLTSLLRQAEKKYFSDKLTEAKDNMAKTWKLINKMTHKSNGRHSIDRLQIGNIAVNNPMEIAEHLTTFS